MKTRAALLLVSLLAIVLVARSLQPPADTVPWAPQPVVSEQARQALNAMFRQDYYREGARFPFLEDGFCASDWRVLRRGGEDVFVMRRVRGPTAFKLHASLPPTIGGAVDCGRSGRSDPVGHFHPPQECDVSGTHCVRRTTMLDDCHESENDKYYAAMLPMVPGTPPAFLVMCDTIPQDITQQHRAIRLYGLLNPTQMKEIGR